MDEDEFGMHVSDRGNEAVKIHPAARRVRSKCPVKRLQGPIHIRNWSKTERILDQINASNLSGKFIERS
jgi:hypothetical protein